MPPAYDAVMHMAAMHFYATDVFEMVEDVVRQTGRLIVKGIKGVGPAFLGLYRGIFTGTTELTKMLNDLANRLNAVKKEAKAATDAMAPLRSLFAHAFSIKKIKSAATFSDNYLHSLSRINSVNDGMQSNSELQSKILAAANRSRGRYLDMTEYVASLGLAAPQVFSGNDEMIAFTELAQKAFRLGGSGAQEQKTGMNQLINAMAAGGFKGNEFTSIMKTAPMLADAISQFTGKSMDELTVLAEKGLITSDIIKWALFGAAEEINAKFQNLPMAFGDVWNQISNSAIASFGPVIERVSQFLSSADGQQLAARISQTIHVAASLVDYLFDGISMIASFVANNWSTIEPILVALGTVWLSLIIYQLWSMIPPLVAQAASWLAMNLPILLIAAAVGLVIYALLQFGITAEQIVGFVFGLFAVLGAMIWNTLVGVINGVIQYLWALINPFVGLIEMILNAIHGGFDGLGGFLKNLAGQIISIFLSVGKIVSKVLDSILGTRLTETLDQWEKEALSWGKNDKAITISRDIPMIGERWEVKKAWEAGYQAGENLVGSIRNGLQGFNLDGLDMESDFPGGNPQKIDQINKVNEVGRINDTVDISNEDLKMMRELAEMNAIQNFVTLTPTVNVRTGDIRNGYDVDTIIARIEQSLTEQIAASAQGVYGLG